MNVPEYTVAALVSVVVVVAVELVWLRTGIFSSARYWISMAIVLGFQVPVDGWLTKLSDPIVLYRESETVGVRFPWDIPVEDFAFGFGMITMVLLVWLRLGADPDRPETVSAAGPAPRIVQESHD